MVWYSADGAAWTRMPVRDNGFDTAGSLMDLAVTGRRAVLIAQPADGSPHLLTWFAEAPAAVHAPATAQPSAPDAATYVGEWSAHAALLVVAADRTGTLDWRTYGGVCSDMRCEGHATLRLDVTPDGVTATIISTTRPADYPEGTRLSVRHSAGGRLKVAADGHELLLLCGPDARPGACGA